MAVLDNVSNPDKIQANITGNGVKLGPYRWRAGNDTPSTLRVEVTGTLLAPCNYSFVLQALSQGM